MLKYANMTSYLTGHKYSSIQAGDMYCAADYLLIPGGRDTLEAGLMSHSHDRYCGGALNPENNAEEGGSVYSRIQVRTS